MFLVRPDRRTRFPRVRHGALAAVATGALVAAPLATSAESAAEGAAEPRRGKSSQHAFMSKRLGYDYVAQWAPCRTVGYRVNLNGVRGKLAQVKEAVARIERASGLDMAYRGRTGIVPGARAARAYPADTQLVVAWARPKATRSLPRGASGFAGFGWRSFEHRRHSYGQITEAYVLVNKRFHYAPGFGAGPEYGLQGTLGQLLMHELGHAVGLSHVRAHSQVMHATISRKRAIWGAGDAAGLDRVGKRRICRALRAQRPGFAVVPQTLHRAAAAAGPAAYRPTARWHEGWE